jgi:anaerobic magnesium-protoporphyrin IX monomethyl ester cyclase
MIEMENSAKGRIDLINFAPVTLNIKESAWFPMGLLYCGSVLKKSGFSVKIYQASRSEMGGICKEIIDRDPLLVGFSSFIGRNIKNTLELMQMLKKSRPEIKIIWGGVHPSLIPEQCLKREEVDFVCIGEGEETIVELADNIQNPDKFSSIKGLGFKQNKKITINAQRPLITDLDKIELDWSLLDNLEQYLMSSAGRRFVQISTSRGCPHNCGFCYNAKFHKKKWRTHSIDYVLRMVTALRKEIRFDGIVFRDDNFFVDRQRGLSIIKSLKSMDIATDWLQITINDLDKEILDEFRALGVNGLCTGWETGSRRLLKLMNKGITPEDIIKKFSYIKENNYFNRIDAVGVIGFPTETWAETKMTINMALSISRLLPNANLALQTYLPFPGTDFFALAVDEGFQVPQDALGWADFDGFDGDFAVSWLKNYPFKNISKYFHYVNRYIFLLNAAKRNSRILTWSRMFFRYMAYFRLKFGIFWFPWEIYLFDLYWGWIKKRGSKKF